MLPSVTSAEYETLTKKTTDAVHALGNRPDEEHSSKNDRR
jgi:hypothetical protein